MVIIFGVAAATHQWRHPSTPTVVTASTANYEFDATPAGIQCELDVNFADMGTRINQAYCESGTTSHVQHVTMTPSGTLTLCHGMNCGSNAGEGTPTFYRGTVVVSGPFRCTIATSSVTCRVRDGRGFIIGPTVMHAVHA